MPLLDAEGQASTAAFPVGTLVNKQNIKAGFNTERQSTAEITLCATAIAMKHGMIVDQLLPMRLGKCHRSAQTAFFTVRDQAANIGIVQSFILFIHFLEDTHADQAAGQIIVGSVSNHAPTDKEQPRNINHEQDRLDHAEDRGSIPS